MSARRLSYHRHRLNGFFLLLILRAVARLNKQKPPRTAMPPKKNRRLLKVLIVGLLFWFVIVPIGALIGLEISAHHRRMARPPETIVPQLKGLELKTAESKAREAQLEPRVLLTRWDIPGPIGVVVNQEPQSGESVPLGTTVGLEVSIEDPDARPSNRK